MNNQTSSEMGGDLTAKYVSTLMAICEFMYAAEKSDLSLQQKNSEPFVLSLPDDPPRKVRPVRGLQFDKSPRYFGKYIRVRDRLRHKLVTSEVRGN
jgi:hypothetical protein